MSMKEMDKTEAYKLAISMPLDKKIEKSIGLFQYYSKSVELWDMFEPWFHLCTSGGKDSVLITWLAEKAKVPFRKYHNVTTLDQPELIYFLRKQHPDCIEIRQKRNLLTVFAEDKGQGPPTRRARWCCEIYKEQGCKRQFKVFGIRAQESNNRKNNWSTLTPRATDKSYVLNPILYFTDEDVWTTIKEEKIPYCSLYDEGWKRLGCIGCPMAGTEGRKKEFARWPKFEQAWQRAFAKFWANWHNYPLEKQRWVSCEGKYPFQPIIGEIRSRGINKESGNIEEGFWTRRRWFDLKGYQTWQELWHWWLQDEEETEDCTMGMF